MSDLSVAEYKIKISELQAENKNIKELNENYVDEIVKLKSNIDNANNAIDGWKQSSEILNEQIATLQKMQSEQFARAERYKKALIEMMDKGVN